ncbi:hypothetical protein E3N88_08287 [Mikania micrantha]|uniref:Uncharacterized protein n=1 Tax=Mikania micrantha TaxID=192012 RepID=A0A5N6PGE2_9ASTR|nr:hypothetical protein E3N88_08287 [Mikania micrantha]
MASSSSYDNNEELFEVVVYAGGKWVEEPVPVQDMTDAVYEPYNGATIEKHHFKMPLNFTCSLLHEHVERAIGSPLHYLTYMFPGRLMESPLQTFIPIRLMMEQDVTEYFKEHVTKQLALGKPIEKDLTLVDLL